MCISSCKCVWDAYSNNTSVLLNASSAVCVCQQPCPLPSQNIKVCSSGPVAFYPSPFWWGTRPGDGGCRVRTKLSLPSAFLLSLTHLFSWSKREAWPWLLFCLLNPSSPFHALSKIFWFQNLGHCLRRNKCWWYSQLTLFVLLMCRLLLALDI